MVKKNGKVLGVLGGMGPAAAAEFLRLLAVYAPAETDQEHPTVIMLGDTDLPDRSAAMLGKGADPGPQMRGDFEKLITWGADVLCAPCNSAHYFIEQFAAELTTPLINIMDVTLAEAAELSPKGAWLLGTQGTLRSGLYQKKAAERGFALYDPLPLAGEWAEQSLRYIKSGNFTLAGERLRQAAELLWRENDVPLVLACTELPLAYGSAQLPDQRAVSSLAALARACLRELYTCE